MGQRYWPDVCVSLCNIPAIIDYKAMEVVFEIGEWPGVVSNVGVSARCQRGWRDIRVWSR